MRTMILNGHSPHHNTRYHGAYCETLGKLLVSLEKNTRSHDFNEERINKLISDLNAPESITVLVRGETGCTTGEVRVVCKVEELKNSSHVKSD